MILKFLFFSTFQIITGVLGAILGTMDALDAF
jgi:hypothetical protein